MIKIKSIEINEDLLLKKINPDVFNRNEHIEGFIENNSISVDLTYNISAELIGYDESTNAGSYDLCLNKFKLSAYNVDGDEVDISNIDVEV